MKNEKAKTVVGDISAPVYLYLGESGDGKDRRIKLEGASLFDKLLNLRKASTYVSIGPSYNSREWNKLDSEDQKYYDELQAKAKKLKTYKSMGDFLSQLCVDNECMLFAIRQGDDAVWVNQHILKELLDTPWGGVDSAWLDQVSGARKYREKVVTARDAGKDYSKIKLENRNEDHGSELLTVIDAVELADEITKADRPFYIDIGDEIENGIDVWAVNSKTGKDYSRSWRVMNNLSVLVFYTDEKGNPDLIEEKSFEDINELGVWLAKEFSNLVGKSHESKDHRNERDEYAEYDEFIAKVILQVCKGSDVSGLEYQDDKLYFIYIGIDELTKALREAGVPEELLAGENIIPGINDTLSYYDGLGRVFVETWDSPSQYFEDPGDGGYRATLDLNDKDQWHAIYGTVQEALQSYALSALDLFGASDCKFVQWIGYGENDIPGIMKEVKTCAKLQAALKEMNLTNADVETLLKAAIDHSTAIDPGNLIIELDGDIDDNW